MADDLNSVKIARATYHHGDLRAALIDAGEAVIADRGVDGFSLREAARRAGVSPGAPAHHFGDARGLLTAIAARAFRRLADRLAEADRGAGPDRRARLHAQGQAYVAFALAHPAGFDLMWRKAMLDGSNADYLDASRAAFRVLSESSAGRSVSPDAAPPEVIAAWAVVHGYARLALDSGMELDAERLDAVLDTLRL